MQTYKDHGRMLSSKHTYKHLMCAVGVVGGYIHQSGTGRTKDRAQAWTGNRQQFLTLCERFGHDEKEFNLIPVWELTDMLTDGENGQH